MSTWEIGVLYPDLDYPTLIGEDMTFQNGMHKLLETAKFNLEHDKSIMDDETHEEYDTLIDEISEIVDDPGFMEDPDQWEDFEFAGPNFTTWYIYEN
jgi:hypothetical protein